MLEQWVVGFVDGEGCFSISVVPQPRVSARLASPARVRRHPGRTIEAGARAPRRGASGAGASSSSTDHAIIGRCCSASP